MKSRKRNVALCYVRKSFTKNGEDLTSPERQRDNITQMVAARGWVAEWYEDTDGHRSGLEEENRPQWLALKRRLTDPDVAALVANDLSRIHRRSWRVGGLLDSLKKRGIELVLADPLRQMSFDTVNDRVFAQLRALLDESYALDVSERQKSHALHRKKQGKTMGAPPFGTKRDSEGYLMPTDTGAWRLVDGTYISGTADESPEDNAVWFGYYDCARRILELYAQGNMGLEKTARKMTEEGWRFKDRYGVPRPVEREDVRRVTGNYPEYGGIVPGTKSKERRFYEWQRVTFNPERAVFDVDLLERVEAVRLTRTQQHPHEGNRADRRTYPLQNLLYCAHCEAAAARAENPRLRSRFGCQTAQRNRRYYRHKAGLSCGCEAKYIPMETIEAAFEKLVAALSVPPEQMENMIHLAVASWGGPDDGEIEGKRTAAIEKARRRLDAARYLYQDGEMSREEYLRIRDENERDIEYWKTYTTETEEIIARLRLSVNTLSQIVMRWPVADDEEKNGLASSLFDYLVYDLDAGRFTDFRLKVWAESLLVLHPSYQADDQSIGLPHRGLEPLF